MSPYTSPRRQAGFTLIEALIALLVMAFGMLAIAGFQVTMSRNSDVAKQRSEAVRLGQLKIEELRAFQQAASDGKTAADVGNVFDYTLDVVDGNDTVTPGSSFQGTNFTSNTAFTRTWAVTRADGATVSTGSDLEKWLRVTVAWNDRTGAAHSVVLRSVISRSDPIDLGTLFTGPGGSNIRTPKNRNIDIPYPATDLGGGKSGFTPPGATGTFYVFDNVTGEVEKVCAGSPTLGFDLSACTSKKAYLLSGYIRFALQNSLNAADLDDPTSHAAKPLTVQMKFVSPTSTTQPYDCFQEVGTNIVTYACVIEPADHDGDEATSPSPTPRQWSGQFVITAGNLLNPWALGINNTDFKLCRYTGDYISDNAISNAEHPLYYRGVIGALDHQNYVVIKGNNTCPSDGEANPLASPQPDYYNNNTRVHQTQAHTAGSQPWGGELSQGTQWGGPTAGESAAATSFPMF